MDSNCTGACNMMALKKELNTVVTGLRYSYKEISLRLSVMDLFAESRNKREIFKFANDPSRGNKSLANNK